MTVYDAASDSFNVSVTVTNTGDVAGKEVVEVYFQSPYTDYDKQNGIEKAAAELCGVVGIAVSVIGLSGLPTQYDPYAPGMNVVVIILFCVIPIIAWAATLIAMKNYALTGEKMKEIQAVNACRKDAIAKGMTFEEAAEKWQTIDQVPDVFKQ